MGIPLPSSREILHRNPFPVGDPRHAAAGEDVLEALLLGTDAEGYAGDRLLLLRAKARLSETWGQPVTVGEAYRLRSADRVEAMFLHGDFNPRSIPGLPGRFEMGTVHAIEVTRADELAFRSSACWRRVGGRGWVLLDPGEAPALARGVGRETLQAAQDTALELGIAVEKAAIEALSVAGQACVDVERALKATSLPRTVRDRASARLAVTATLSDVIVTLADVAAACDREEGETYARAAGRLAQRAAPIGSAAAAVAGGTGA